MVGVPGKYKGCNTCRRRRVRCGMERPACKKCEDSARECGGYDRDLTFIVGTPAQKGRCSSHPHRSILKANQEGKKTSTQPKQRAAPTNVTSVPIPWTSTSSPKQNVVVQPDKYFFVHTNSLALDPKYDTSSDESFHLPSFSSSLPFLDTTHVGHEFSIQGCAFIEDNKRTQRDYGDVNPRPAKRAHVRSSPTSAPRQEEQDPSTLYLFHAAAESPNEEPTFEHVMGGTPDEVKQQSPTAFLDPPAHRFFSHLWRPLAITHALRQERKTFLEESAWCTGPFEKVDKNSFDKLWDVIAKLPGICGRARRTVDITDQNVNPQLRRMKSEDLLRNCSNVLAEFDQWLVDMKASEEANELSSLYWTVASITQRNRRRSSPSSQKSISPFPQHEFRDTETAHLLVTYWAALYRFYKMVAEVLIVAEPPQDAGVNTQLPYRPSAGASPAYNSSSPRASISSASATSPPVSINASDYSGYSLPPSTHGYAGYDVAAANGSSFNPQYAAGIFLAQQPSSFLNFSTDTYTPTTSYAVSSGYPPDPGYTDTTFTPVFDASMNMFPPQAADFDFNDLSYLNVDATYISDNSTGMDYLPPPQRNPTPSSYISAPGSHQSHQSPVNSFISAVSSAAASRNASHAATPPDHSSYQASSPTAVASSFSNPNDKLFALWQNSRPDKLVQIGKLLGSGLDFLLNQDVRRDADVVLLLWPLEVLEGMWSTASGSHGSHISASYNAAPHGSQLSLERVWCGGTRREMERRAQEMGSWVRDRRWKAVGEDED